MFEQLIGAIVEQLNAAVFTLLAILGAALWGMFKLGEVTKSFKDYLSDKEQLDKKLGEFQKTLADVNATSNLLYQAHLSTVQKKSPLSLTEIGEQVAEGIDARQKVKMHWPAIFACLSDYNLDGRYDVQMAAQAVARECFDDIFTDTERQEIKTFAYDEGLDLLEIYPVLGILIRDKFFEEHPELVADEESLTHTKNGDQEKTLVHV